MILETAVKVLESGYVCDYCLGRQFAKLGSGCSDMERGRIIRGFLSMEHEAGKTGADSSNFRNPKGKKCTICGNVFERIPEMVRDIIKKTKNMDFESFLTGVKMNDSLVMNEEALFERAGMKYSEPVKSEISGRIAKLLAEKTGKKISHDRPDALFIFDLQNMQTEIISSSLFVYGEYKKFVRGLPQSSSPRYKQTVQDIISGPLLKATKASSDALHALGREDKDARCLVWRPFILELKQPVRRKIELNGVKKRINMSKKVKVNKLRFADRKEIASLKARRPFKVYSITVDFEKPVERIGQAKKLVGIVKQRTPSRVLSTKPDKAKNKKVKSIKWKRINNIRYRFEITAESGLYIKELVSGDSGRTNPSVSKVLGNQANIKEFDLVGLKE